MTLPIVKDRLDNPEPTVIVGQITTVNDWGYGYSTEKLIMQGSVTAVSLHNTEADAKNNVNGTAVALENLVTTVPGAGQLRIHYTNKFGKIGFVEANVAQNGKWLRTSCKTYGDLWGSKKANAVHDKLNKIPDPVGAYAGKVLSPKADGSGYELIEQSGGSGYVGSTYLFADDADTLFHILLNESSGDIIADTKGNNGTANNTHIVSTPFLRGRRFGDSYRTTLAVAYPGSNSPSMTVVDASGFSVNDVITIANPNNVASARKYDSAKITAINGNELTITYIAAWPGAYDANTTEVYKTQDWAIFPGKGAMIPATGSFTVEMLVTPHKLGRNQYIFSKDGTVNGKRQIVGLQLTYDNKFVGLCVDVTSNHVNTVSGVNAIEAGKQYYVTFVRDVSAMKSLLYINGYLEAEASFANIADMTDGLNTLNYYLCCNAQQYYVYSASVTVDEISIRSGIKTASQILQTQNSRP